MKGLRLRIARLVAALAGVSLIWACNAPFIPVPPPGATFTSELVTDGAGGMKVQWTAHGDPEPRADSALFTIIDLQRNAGVAVYAMKDGTYVSPPMEGTEGDHVQIFYETPEGDRSASACLVLQPSPIEMKCPPP